MPELFADLIAAVRGLDLLAFLFLAGSVASLWALWKVIVDDTDITAPDGEAPPFEPHGPGSVCPLGDRGRTPGGTTPQRRRPAA